MAVAEVDHVVDGGLVLPACRSCNFLYILVHLLTSAATRIFVLAGLAFYNAHSVLHTDCYGTVLQVFFLIALVVYTICSCSIIGYC